MFTSTSLELAACCRTRRLTMAAALSMIPKNGEATPTAPQTLTCP